MSSAPAQLINMPISVRGSVESVLFSKPENDGYAVMRLGLDNEVAKAFHPKLLNAKKLLTITGKGLSSLKPGEVIAINGKVTMHQHFGYQVEVTDYILDTPKTVHEIELFLTRHINQISKVLAKKIVDKFGVETLSVIEKTPDRLGEITLIGPGRLEEIKKAWVEMSKERELLMFFVGIGLPSRFKAACVKEYGEKCAEMIREDPYRLARDIKGVGWEIADTVAKKLNIHELSEVRIQACAVHCIDEQQRSGHCFLYLGELIQKIVVFLNQPGIAHPMVKAIIDKAVERTLLVNEEDRIYLPHIFVKEILVTHRLLKIKHFDMPAQLADKGKLEEAFLRAVAKSPVVLDESQKMAVWRSLNSKVAVITGRPGTGKTTVTKTLVRAYQNAGLPITLMAPTGRAAKRMSEVIGLGSTTIHYALYMCQKYDQSIGGVLIVDESSMIDIALMAWLLSNLENDVILIFVGDVDQLPSVGPGATLRDMINSQVIPVSALTQIYRQAAMSDIIMNAHAINNGFLQKPNKMSRNGGIPPNTDYFTCFIDEPDTQIAALTYLTRTFIPAFGFDPCKDLQVMSPGHEGLVGVANLNAHLQKLLNPTPGDYYEPREGMRWGVGDRMMNVKNSKELGLSNGDQGILLSITRKEDRVVGLNIQFDFGPVEVPVQWFKNIQLSYASTVHKMQGNESPVCIIMLHTCHWMLLQRSLFYTGFTRARKLLIVVANSRALAAALRRDDSIRRNTWLAERLRTTNPEKFKQSIKVDQNTLEEVEI